jgi:transcriptional regulator GlxA family with amidase domain
MALWDPPAEIGILLYPDVAWGTVHGLTDLFNVATTLAREHCGPSAPILRVTHWRVESEKRSVDCVFDTHPHLPHGPAAVIVPGSWRGQPAADVRSRLIDWLGERHAAAQRSARSAAALSFSPRPDCWRAAP